MILFLVITISLGIVLIVSFYNLLTAPVIKSSYSNLANDPLISVLIPARNEDKNIENCLIHLVNQDNDNIEILVLDDHSTDKTAQIVESYTNKYNQIRLIKGNDLPEFWHGKNWACHQLSLQAKGDYLLFIDADVELKEKTISSVLDEMINSEVKMISAFSTQTIKSFGEWLIVPLMNFLLLAFLPLKLVYSSRNKSLVAANGQFMFWERNTYFKINGHKTVKDKIVEDMEFARLCKSHTIKIKTMLGGDLIYCRMYPGLNEGINGFSKNFYPGFNINPAGFLIMITFFFVIFLMPFFLIFYSSLFYIPLLFIFLIRLFISVISKQDIFINIVLHPLQMVFMLFIGIKSVINSKTGKVVWKGRRF